MIAAESEVIVEHLVNAMMDIAPITTPGVKPLLEDFFAVMVITKDEHEKLNASGLRSTMPEDWDKKMCWPDTGSSASPPRSVPLREEIDRAKESR